MKTLNQIITEIKEISNMPIMLDRIDTLRKQDMIPYIMYINQTKIQDCSNTSDQENWYTALNWLYRIAERLPRCMVLMYQA